MTRVPVTTAEDISALYTRIAELEYALEILIVASQDVADEIRRNDCQIGMVPFIAAIRQARGTRT